MTKKFLAGMVLLMMILVACTQKESVSPKLTDAGNKSPQFNQTAAGSYIVKAAGDGEVAIRRTFAQYGVSSVRSLGNDQFELRLKIDPGIDALVNLVANSGGAVQAIQPNYLYRAN